MEGRLYKTENGKWFINHEKKIIPLHPEINLTPTPINNYGSGCDVYFIIVDEFTHPYLFENISWGDGTTCAWLTTENSEDVYNRQPAQIDKYNTIYNDGTIKSIKELGKKTPNDMDFGGKVRKLINKI